MNQLQDLSEMRQDHLRQPVSPVLGEFWQRYPASLNEDYRQAQERDGVITSLEPCSLEDARQAIRTSNRKVLEAFRKNLAASSLSFKMIEQHANTIKTFTDAYLAACDSPRSLLDLNVDDLQRYRGGQGKNADLVSFNRLIRFLLKYRQNRLGQRRDDAELLEAKTAEQHLKVMRDTAWTVALRRSCPFSLRSCS